MIYHQQHTFPSLYPVGPSCTCATLIGKQGPCPGKGLRSNGGKPPLLPRGPFSLCLRPEPPPRRLSPLLSFRAAACCGGGCGHGMRQARLPLDDLGLGCEGTNEGRKASAWFGARWTRSSNLRSTAPVFRLSSEATTAERVKGKSNRNERNRRKSSVRYELKCK